jgi:FlaA1/EpsC-like NDP-sugar epimerase
MKPTALFNLIKYTPRWVIFQIDVLICIFSIFLAYLLRFNFELESIEFSDFSVALLLLISVKSVFFLITRSFAGIIKYTSIEDAKRIFQALSFSFLVVFLVNSLNYYINDAYIIPVSVLIIDYFVSMLSMCAIRILSKIMYFEWKNLHNINKKVNVIIYGAGEAGVITKKTISQDKDNNLNVVAFLDDDPGKVKNTIDGIHIYQNNHENLVKLIKLKKVEILIMAIQELSPEKKKEVIDTCLAFGIQARSIPPVQKWINGELSLKQIKDVNIEDVLGRAPIQLDKTKIKQDIEGKTVMITGAAGSIGSELTRQILLFSPKNMILIDQAESALYDLELELSELPYIFDFQTKLCDITNASRMEKLFRKFKPDIVFHAAAYKHVPVMEDNPAEAVQVNILGTKILADLSAKYNVEKFIMISTDKAVNPTSVMGASKRIAEIYTQSLNNDLCMRNAGAFASTTRFITTRFGNVLGSNGSVIPRFRRQIAQGGPVTVTHPDITRFFMTIPEACQLVLEASSMGEGGEIFLFDMGKSIKIVDLAKKMIKLSGLTLGKDIQLIYTGLRPGEKLYEELLSNEENTKPTHHPQILIAKTRNYSFSLIQEQIYSLLNLLSLHNNESIILCMKKIVPEYISNNSIYERLDKPQELVE